MKIPSLLIFKNVDAGGVILVIKIKDLLLLIYLRNNIILYLRRRYNKIIDLYLMLAPRLKII